MLKEKIHITYNLDEVADSLNDGIQFLKEHNLNSAEVRTIDGKNIAKLSLKETKKLKEILDSHGITVAAIASPLFKWYDASPNEMQKADLFGMDPYISREEKEKMIRKIIEQACILETDKIRIFSGLKPDEGDYALPKEESDLLLLGLKLAKEKNVQLLLENEPVCYISKLTDYIKIFTSGKYDGLRAWFDIANIYEDGEQLKNSDLVKLAPYIEYLHIKDPVAPKVHKYVPLGKGYINYKRIFDLLEKEIKNPVKLSIETHVKNDKWNASHESLEYLHRLLLTERTRYALVGVGRISAKHFHAIRENDNCTLVGVFDIDKEKSRSSALAQDCINYSSYEDLLNDEQVDVVSICTPHDIHIDIAQQAIEKDKKILCEKPLALNVDDLERYINNIDKPGSTYVIFQNKFNSAVKNFYFYKQRSLGRPQFISMALRWWRDDEYYTGWHGCKLRSGGALITQAIHSLKLISDIVGNTNIKNISCTKLKTRDNLPFEDIIVAQIKFDNGIICNIEVCLATRNQNLESSVFVVGSHGSFKISGVALNEVEHPKKETEEEKNGDDYYGHGHKELYRAHSNKMKCVEDIDGCLLTSPSELLNVIKLIEAMEKIMKS